MESDGLLRGAIGEDVLTGGLGADELWVGDGVDTLVVNTVTDSTSLNTDIIADFEDGIALIENTDDDVRIELTGLYNLDNDDFMWA